MCACGLKICWRRSSHGAAVGFVFSLVCPLFAFEIRGFKIVLENVVVTCRRNLLKVAAVLPDEREGC